MKYVFSTSSLKRYEFPTHINDLVMDRSEAETSEVFIVVLKPGQAPPLHKHGDTEQLFYILEGEGTLTIKEGEEETYYPVNVGDVVRVPMSLYHSIKAEGGKELRYLAIDCFVDKHFEDEKTWDNHVKVLCKEQGWDYNQVVKSSA